MEKTSFLTNDEKRAIIGYGALPAPKFNPGQIRVPAGRPGGGRWGNGPSGGGGGGTTGSDFGTGDGGGADGGGDGVLSDAAQADPSEWPTSPNADVVPAIVYIEDKPVPDKPQSSPYSSDKPGWHYYKSDQNTVCTREQVCSSADMKNYLSRFSFPGQDENRPIQNNDISVVTDPVLGLPVGHIRTEVAPDGISIKNITLPDHFLYDGQVVREAIQAPDGSWYMQSTGTGNNTGVGRNKLNEFIGPGVFNGLDKRMRLYIERDRRDK